ncbi:red-sensitive opsin-like, partial [Lineus longissimus]|uniref:red-sensitive opsin-like n=1 Tax=Lineus longissimus TaxID=88925 RepID=UPI00315DA669
MSPSTRHNGYISRRGSPPLNPPCESLFQMTVLLAIAYMICWSPYAIVSFIKSFSNLSIDPLATLLPAVFAKSSASVNFVIYILTNKRFRDALSHMYGIRQCCNRPVSEAIHDSGILEYNLTASVTTDFSSESVTTSI